MGVKKIATSISEIAAETLQKTGSTIVNETAKTTAAVASQVTGQTYVAKQQIQAQRNQKVKDLSMKDTSFKEDALAKARKELQNVHSSPEAPIKQPQPSTPKPTFNPLSIEHHQKAQVLEKPDEETLKRRRELDQKAQLELEEKQKEEEEKKQKDAQLVVPQGKQSGPLFGKKPKKPLIVKLEQTKTETRGGVGG